MNHLERTIIASIACYPSYEGRFAVLDHVFCTIGNGYEWSNGRLEAYNSKINLLGSQEEFEDSIRLALKIRNKDRVKRYEMQKNDETAKLVEKTLQLDIYKELVKMNKDFEDFENKQYQKFYAPIVFDMKEFKRKSQIISVKAENIYPISSRYSAICNIPENATIEYVLGALEMISMILLSNSDDPDGIWARQRTNREHVESNKSKARLALKRIEEIWGKNE